MMMRKLHEIEDTISGEWKYLVENDLCKIEELVKSFANEYRQGGFIVQVPKIVDMRAMLLTALMRDRKQGNESKEKSLLQRRNGISLYIPMMIIRCLSATCLKTGRWLQG